MRKENKKSVSNEALEEMEYRLRDAFSKVKEELNDHRECLNQNTNEIQGNYEYICRLDGKIDKISERLDELSLFIQQNMKVSDKVCQIQEEENKFSVSTLTRKEQEVFVALYLSDEGATYDDIAKRTGLTENLVICYVTNLIAKGIPLVKKYLANGLRLYLDPEFKQLQTQKNILKISETVTKSIINN